MENTGEKDKFGHDDSAGDSLDRAVEA